MIKISNFFLIFLLIFPQIAEADGGSMLISRYIKGDISDDPGSTIWEQITAVQIPLFSQVRFEPRWFDGKVRSISVRSINNGERIAFLLEWEDKTEDRKGDGFKDGAAIEFPVGKEKAHFAHASRMEQLPGGKVNIWYWRGDSPDVKDMNAEGMGTLMLQQNQDVTGKGIWNNNKWKVVFLRSLKSADNNDVNFQPYEYKDIAFAIWDGSNGEHASQKTLSTWYYLQIGAPLSRMVYVYSSIAIIAAGLFELFIIRKLKESKKGILLLILLSVVLNGCARNEAEELGSSLYAKYCTPCHGINGAGDGFNAKYLDPKPRDHTDSKEDYMAKRDNQQLFDAVAKGGKGIAKSSLMPPYGYTLSENEIWSLVAYMRTLHPNKSEKVSLKDAKTTGKKKGRPNIEKMAIEGEPSAEEVQRGERLFSEKYGCFSCHRIGEKGGIIGPALDRAGFRLNADWVQKWIINPQSIKRETIMPNFGMPERDARFLTLYLKYLKGT